MVFEVAKAWTQTFYDPEIVLRNLSFYYSVALHCDAQISAEDICPLGPSHNQVLLFLETHSNP